MEMTIPSRWQADDDGALRVALGNAASSFGHEGISAREAADVLRRLAGGRIDLLVTVARTKLESRHGRAFPDQVAEMRAAAALLLAHSG